MRFQLVIHSGNGKPHPMVPDTAGGTFREMEGFREDMLGSAYTVCPGNHNLFERIMDGRIVAWFFIQMVPYTEPAVKQ